MTILGRPIVALVISTKNPYKIYQVSSPLATKNALQLNSAHTALNSKGQRETVMLVFLSMRILITLLLKIFL